MIPPPPLVYPGAPAPSEEAVQAQCVEMLRDYLPDEMAGFWSATLNGVRLPTPGLAAKAKRQGLNPGPLDLMFLWPDGATTFIEMKPPYGRDAKGKLVKRELTTEQQQWAGRLGRSRFALCRSWTEVYVELTNQMRRHGLRWNTDTEAFRRRRAARDAVKRTNRSNPRKRQRGTTGTQAPGLLG